MTRRLLLNPMTGTHHVHYRCKGLMKHPQVLDRLREVHVKWADMPTTKLCRFCCPGEQAAK